MSSEETTDPPPYSGFIVESNSFRPESINIMLFLPGVFTAPPTRPYALASSSISFSLNLSLFVCYGFSSLSPNV